MNVGAEISTASEFSPRRAKDPRMSIEVRLSGDTVWPMQAQVAEAATCKRYLQVHVGTLPALSHHAERMVRKFRTVGWGAKVAAGIGEDRRSPTMRIGSRCEAGNRRGKQGKRKP